jgi:magnesium transporter
MVYRSKHSGGIWVDLEQPSEDEVRAIAREFSLGERIVAELIAPSPAPLVAGEGDLAFSILHFPTPGSESGTVRNQEIDFIVGKKFIITVRYEVIAPLHEIRKLLETEAIVAGRTPFASDVLLEVLFAHLYESVRDHTRQLADRLERIERAMFSGHERTSVRDISDVSREFLHLEAALRGQEEPLERFMRTLVERRAFGANFEERAERILAERLQVAHLVETHRAMASELRATNAALLESRQNEIMKTLTVANFIFLPLELIAFVFGMHVLGTPLEQNPDAFWIIMGFMAIIIVLMTGYFAKKRWIF